MDIIAAVHTAVYIAPMQRLQAFKFALLPYGGQQRQMRRFADAKQFKLNAPNTRIFLPKLGWMRLRLSRPVLGQLRNATVSYSSGKWFVSI